MKKSSVSNGNFFSSSLEYMIALFLIIGSSSIYSLIYPTNYIYIALICMLSFSVIISILTIGVTAKELTDLIIKVITVTILIGIYCLHTLSAYPEFNMRTYLLLLLVFDLLVLELGIKNYRERSLTGGIIERFYRLTVILATISVCCWILVSIVKVLPVTGYTGYFWGGDRLVGNFLKIYFESQDYNFMGIVISRNSGIFPEAPMYAFVLIIASAYGYFIRGDRDRNIVCLVITMFSTLSMTAIIMAIFIGLCYFMKKFKGGYQAVLGTVVVPIMFVGFGYLLAQLLSFKSSNDTLSTSLRLDDIKAGYLLWKVHPYLGAGMDNLAALQQYMSAERLYTYMGVNQAWYSLGWSAILAYGGLYLTLIYSYPLLRSIVLGIKYRNSIWIFSFVIILSLFILIVYGSPLFIFTLAYLWINSNKETLQRT